MDNNDESFLGEEVELFFEDTYFITIHIILILNFILMLIIAIIITLASSNLLLILDFNFYFVIILLCLANVGLTYFSYEFVESLDLDFSTWFLLLKSNQIFLINLLTLLKLILSFLFISTILFSRYH